VNVSTRLSAAVAAILAGCAPELDDVACLAVAEAEPCPGEEAAAERLVGTRTCETPVRQVQAVGALVSDEVVVFTASGATLDLSDTGGETGEVLRNCCYEAAYSVKHSQSCTIGRPLTEDGRMVTAAPGGDGWTTDDRPSLRGLSADDRARLTEAWQEQGLLEHASVAAFARLVLDLLELGAPAELVDRASTAMQDEIRHAARCFALASAYAGHEVGPGPLPMPARRGKRTLPRLAAAAWREGCVGETLSVALAAAQLHRATDPVVRDVLAGILRDESAHAALSWDLVDWAVSVGGAATMRAVRREARRTHASAPIARGPSPGMIAHGVPDDGVVREALARVAAGVIAPAAAELLD
jgi:hypothetical protein